MTYVKLIENSIESVVIEMNFKGKPILVYIIGLAATPLEASRGTGRKGKSRPHPILN